METAMPMTTTSTYSPHCLPADVPLPVEADGTIRIWFAMRELRFASVAEPTLFSVKYEGAESVSRAKITTFLDNYKTVVVLATNPMEAFEAFALQMEWVEAAGGVVESERGEVVMIRRNSRWDLPKGHREAGETFGVCAAREAEEETGVVVKDVERLLTTTLHAYNLYGRWELKLTAWYAMWAERCDLTPQQEEGIIGAEWVAREEIAEKIKCTFPTIKAVFEAFFK
ncbi:MAG: NUDIX domain-containing protein [Alistipes sp.]|nr:NUDIX domain-containing protein [Alistipes sp.]